MIEMKETYNLGPRSDENSQWNMIILCIGPSGTTFGDSVFVLTSSVIICSCVYRFWAPRMCPPSNSYGYRQSMTLNDATESLKSPCNSLAIVSTEIDFKSRWRPSINGKQNGRLKSPIKCGSDDAIKWTGFNQSIVTWIFFTNCFAWITCTYIVTARS